jgi:hypothetical protein
MKKLLISLLCLSALFGCKSNETSMGTIPTITVDGIITEKYIYHELDDETQNMRLDYHLVYEVGYPLNEEKDISVSFYVYSRYEVGDTIKVSINR